MKHCHYCGKCGKELKDTQVWCPYCMHRQQKAKLFENTSVKREVRRTRAVRLLPCCLAAASAVVLTAVLLSAALHQTEPAAADNLPSAYEAPIVLTEPEITSDPEVATEVPSSASTSPSTPSVQEYVLQEADMNSLAQELTEYLHQQYPNHLSPSEKLPGMKQEFFYLSVNLYREQTYRYVIDSCAHTVLTSTQGLSFCYDEHKAQKHIPWELGKDIHYYYPENDSPLLSTALFTIEYLGLSDEYHHQFALYYLRDRPVPKTEQFNSGIFLQTVRELMSPQYTWIDSFVKEEIPYREADYFLIGAFYKNETDLAQALISNLNLNISDYSSYPYYDVYVSEFFYNKNTGEPCITVIIQFFEERP